MTNTRSNQRSVGRRVVSVAMCSLLLGVMSGCIADTEDPIDSAEIDEGLSVVLGSGEAESADIQRQSLVYATFIQEPFTYSGSTIKYLMGYNWDGPAAFPAIFRIRSGNTVVWETTSNLPVGRYQFLVTINNLQNGNYTLEVGAMLNPSPPFDHPTWDEPIVYPF